MEEWWGLMVSDAQLSNQVGLFGLPLPVRRMWRLKNYVKLKSNNEVCIMWSLFQSCWLQLGKSNCGKRLICFLLCQLPHPLGIHLCMNLFSLVYIFLSSLTLLGLLGTPVDCSRLQRNCKRCSKTLLWTDSIFCQKFSWNFGDWGKCHGVWCGDCYLLLTTNFLVAPNPEKNN